MDEYNSGMDPEMKRYFRKIMSSFSWGALWLLTTATLGIFFQLGFVADGFRWYNVIFYLSFLASVFLLVRYYYRMWR
ncbi:MAG: hypothetical protein ACXVLT_06750 [Flavisolibacter sp.]